jgi:hypothetical protein
VILRHCERYGVEFILLPPPSPPAARERLVASGEFRERSSGSGYVLLERARAS